MNPVAKILVVDDTPVTLRVVSRLLAKAGYEVFEAGTGQECLDLAASQSPDLILLDVQLPDISGIEVCQRIKANPKLSHTFVVHLTAASTASEQQIKGLESGADGYITQPITKRELIARVQAMLRIAAAEKAQRLSEARLQLAVETANIGLFDWDIATNQVYFSAQWKAQLGYAENEITDSFEEWESRLHPEDRDRMVTTVKLYLAEPWRDYETEFRLRHKDGSYRTIFTRATLVLDAQGRPTRMVGTHLDVTERANLEAKLRHSHKLEAVGQLAGGVAHEFNNILTIIQGRASLLEFTEKLSPEGLDSIQQINASTDRAARLTRQMLTFSRRQMMLRQHLDLNGVVRSLAVVLVPIVGSRVKLEIECAEKLPLIRADVVMLEQLLLNLALNAREAMPETGGRVVIQTKYCVLTAAQARRHPDAREGRFISVAVQDNGRGISAEVMPRIFEPFFTTKEVGQGTGMGLATVYGIVKQHEGWIEVESQPGTGATFTAFFPVSHGSLATGNLPEGRVQSGGEVVLLVEDEPDVRLLARLFLKRDGYQVLEAEHAAQALEVWRENAARIGLLLVDIVMPGSMNGRELGARLLIEKPTLKVIYTSGYDLDWVGSNTKIRDGVDFLQKPYSPTRLLEVVSQRLKA